MKRASLIAGSLLAALAAGACSSTQDILEPSAIAASPPAAGVLAGEVQTVSGATTNTARLNPGIAAHTRLRFDPLVGPTADAAAPFTERLAERARARGIELASSADPAATHVMKGYFSILTEDSGTIVIYVWDVYDAAGHRLHRINGQQKAPAGRGEGWAAVPPVTMQSIADSTVDQLASWLASATG